MLRNFIRSQQAEEFRANKEGQRRFLDLKMEIVLAFDLAWRMGRRLKHDRGEMYKIASAAASKGDKPRRRPAGKQAALNLLQLPTTGGDISKRNRTKRPSDASSSSDKRILPKERRSGPSIETILPAPPLRFADRGNIKSPRSQVQISQLLDDLLNIEVPVGSSKDSGK
ncbi:hypothetical protein FRC09_010997 [Ceratobasidium sp. 395]|nr:hypothetical protein FRC09_010997 [Ceratobasidium sp. 395]